MVQNTPFYKIDYGGMPRDPTPTLITSCLYHSLDMPTLQVHCGASVTHVFVTILHNRDIDRLLINQHTYLIINYVPLADSHHYLCVSMVYFTHYISN